ncbi:hypothetical protein [Flavihumibacter cheonanensis]|uniref:hypothetical protein n=1 Tax=Flavihumibacter cheonanensis TaxID=1442385 RepID=UPI001EF7C4C1|nr:hypothetical protein [Flavihumibacter cheonanensis]MCG7754799.1 hypothetical protein [Flavihumibacter cheonanensis]
MKLQRPLKDKELKILDKRLNQLDRNFKSQKRFLFFWTLLVFVVGTFAYFKMDSTSKVLLLVATVVIYIGIGAWVTGKEYLKQQKERKSIAFLKNKNLVTVVEVNSDLYYELKEHEDEGVHYLFQLPDNKVFSFGGQDFYPNRKFPSDKFEVVEGRGLNNEILLLETFSYGKKIKPTRVIAGQEKWNLLNNSNYPDPEKLTVVDGRIEDYLQVAAT